jgi:hypothetical protein
MVNRRIVLWFTAAGIALAATKFYPDDPLARMPPPLPVKHALSRTIDPIYDFFVNSGKAPRQTIHGKPAPAGAINTLGEVPDNDWYTNRQYSHRMSLEELRRGPDRGNAPTLPLEVTSAKTEGVTPGFNVKDARGRKYLVKFDPPDNPEMATATDVIGSKFFYAFGYNVPENYIVNFRRDQLKVASAAKITDADGAKRHMEQGDLDVVLNRVPKTANGSYRGMASFYIAGNLLGPFRYNGTRKDDPNDIVLHENRRDLRGLYVFCAWLQHTDAKSGNSLDTLVEVDGIPRIRHYLIDFGAILGSDSDAPKNPKLGHEYFIDYKPGLYRLLTLGLYVPDWEREHFDAPRSVGNLSAEDFDPDHWTNNYPNPAFQNRLPDDEFWAAKQVVAFRPEEIRAMVETAEYSDPRATEYVSQCLLERQQMIGKVLLNKVLPLDRFSVRDGNLVFEDVAVQYGFSAARHYSFQWFRFNNETGAKTPLAGEASAHVPASAGNYYGVDIRSEDPKKVVTVYLRKDEVAGIERTW